MLTVIVISFRRPKRPKRPKRLQIPFNPNPSIDRTRDRPTATGKLVFGSSERPGNPIDAAEIPIVRDNDVAIGQGARPTERPEKNSARARHRVPPPCALNSLLSFFFCPHRPTPQKPSFKPINSAYAEYS